jgi:RNA polymerase-binding transcription factor DksA
VADIIDDAQAYNELHQEVSLRNQQAKMLPEAHPDFDGWHCVDCADKIPAKRLGWGRIRCTSCQERLEYVRRLAKHNVKEVP